jgi:hypothetical protein
MVAEEVRELLIGGKYENRTARVAYVAEALDPATYSVMAVLDTRALVDTFADKSTRTSSNLLRKII